MIGIGELIAFCLFLGLVALGAGFGRRLGPGPLGGAGLGLLAFVTLGVLYYLVLLLLVRLEGDKPGRHTPKGDELPEEEKRARSGAAMAKDGRWNPVREAIFERPEGPHVCPFCGRPTVRAAWLLYWAEPRGAGFDAWCESCGERHHCVALLPAHAPDCYPPR